VANYQVGPFLRPRQHHLKEHIAMSEPFLGEIKMFGGNFAPRGWALCNGQILSIAQNTALFSLLGTTYGGNGQTTFALPNLQSRIPIAPGQGPGLTNYDLGEEIGTESVTLLSTEMPQHSHVPQAQSGPGTSTTPQSNVWAASSSRDAQYGDTLNTPMSATALPAAGGGQPHSNMQPYLVINFIIALQGIFPPRQ
jgi:microcystin-dependent protein